MWSKNQIKLRPFCCREALFESHAHMTECYLSEIKQVGRYVPQLASHSLGGCSQCQVTCIKGAEATTCNGAMPTLSLTSPSSYRSFKGVNPKQNQIHSHPPKMKGKWLCPHLSYVPAQVVLQLTLITIPGTGGFF